jgi:ABC-type sugar transport system ATPase subunit
MSELPLLASVAEGARVVLRTTSLWRRYGPNRALSETSFAIEAGQVVAIVGENGVGKSTLSKIRAGATRPDGGEEIVAEVEHLGLAERRIV